MTINDLINWPATALILGLFVILRFGRQLSSLIERTHTISNKGIRFRKPDQQAPLIQSEQRLIIQQSDSVPNATLSHIEIEIRSELERLGDQSATDREDLLVKSVAAWKLAAILEALNARIFSSQVHVLAAAATDPQGLSPEEIRPHYEFSIGDHSEDPAYGLPGYMQFLLDSHLMVQSNGRYQITSLGRDYLKFEEQNGHTGPKFM